MRDAAGGKGGFRHDVYPLRTVTARTGLSADIIRAWERRYGVVAPIRGARGARLYRDADIAHLHLLARVVASGRAIGDVAALSPAELARLATPSTRGREETSRDGTASRESVVARVLELLQRFDHTAVAALLGDAVVGLGPRAFVHDVAAPVVDRVGACWAKGELSIAEEHLLTGTLRTLLAGLVRRRVRTGRPVLLATPAGERHELGLLLVSLLALDAGLDVLNLGVDLPAAEIAAAAARAQARVVGVSVVASHNRPRAVREIATLQRALAADVELWLGGADAGRTAARIPSFRGMVVDRLNAAESELERVALRAGHPA